MNKIYKASKTIDLTKGENFMDELRKMIHLKEEFYYVNIFEGKHALMQFEVTDGEFTEVVDFSGMTIPYIMSHLSKSTYLNSTILEVEVKGALD